MPSESFNRSDISSLSDEFSALSRHNLLDDERNSATRPRSARLGRGSVFLRKLTINKLRFEEDVLFGRDKEIARLNSIFKGCETSRELVLIEGATGAGKSALGESLRKTAARRSGFFLSGKFDQQERYVPYSAIASACRGVCVDLLEHSERDSSGMQESITSLGEEYISHNSMRSLAERECSIIQSKKWRFSFRNLQQKLRDDLGKDSQVLTAVVPTLNQIIVDEQISTEQEASAYDGAKSRLVFAFRKFMRVLCSFGPVCLFLDDVQWVDFATLDLLEALVTDTGNTNLTIVTSYRTNELVNGHPFSKLVTKLEAGKGKSEFEITKITVENLDVGHVNEIVSIAINTEPEKTMALAELTFKKTQGNVFHVIQYLQSLVDRKLLTFVLGVNKWQFDTKAISTASKPTENVVDLITGRMNNLPEGVRCLLPMVACLGANFSQEAAELIVKHFGPQLLSARPEDIYEISDFMEVCILEGLIIQTSGESYQWEHDRLQEAALLIPSESESIQMQFSVGKLLLDQLSEAGLSDMIFTLTVLLGKESFLGDDATMRLTIVRLHLRAGNSAIQSAAFHSAAKVLSKGIALFPKDKWNIDSDLCLELYSQGAVTAYSQGNFVLMEEYADEVISRSDLSLLDKRRVYNVLALALQAKGQIEATRVVLTDLLAQLGCKFPPQIAWLPKTIFGLRRVKKSLDKALAIFPLLSEPEDESKIWTMQLIDNLATALFTLKSNLLFLVILRGYNYAMEYGSTKYLPPILATTSLLLAAGLNDYKGARKLASQSILMSENHRSTQARALHITSYFTLHHQIPVETCIKNLLRAYQVGLATGETEPASFGIVGYLRMIFYTGGCLVKLNEDFAVYCHQLHDFGQYKSEFMVRGDWQVVADLISGHFNKTALDGDCFIKKDFDEYFERTQDDHGMNQCQRCYIHSAFWHGDYESVVRVMKAANLHRGVSDKINPGDFANMPLYFHLALSCQLLARQTGKKKYTAISRKICKKKLSFYVANGNPNVSHYELLLKAGFAFDEGKTMIAKGLYDSAILFTQRRGFTNDLGLSHELKGRAMLDDDDVDDARYHLSLAARFFKDWGAPAKATRLAVEFPILFAPPVTIVLDH